MAAMYVVDFDDGRYEMVYSADSKSLKKKDVRFAYVKARKKGEAKHAKATPGGKLVAKVVNVRCVG